MDEDLRSFEQFMKDRTAAAGAYVSGDAAPLGRIVTRQAPATFFGPGGGHTAGAAEVASRYERDATRFKPGSENQLELLHFAASGGIGYWVGFQRASVRMEGKPDPVPMTLRVTEVFRRESGAWKMIHRHADMLATESK